MKRIAVVLLSGLVCLAATSAEFKPASSVSSFPIAFNEDSMTETAVSDEASKSMPVARAYKLEYKKIKGELRYSLYTDPSLKKEDAAKAIEALAKKILPASAGVPPFEVRLRPMKEAAVKSSFNADLGYGAVFKSVKSKFAGDYKCMAVNFVYKQGAGLVVRTFLFNDMNFMGFKSDNSVDKDNPFAKYNKSFKFSQK